MAVRTMISIVAFASVLVGGGAVAEAEEPRIDVGDAVVVVGTPERPRALVTLTRSRADQAPRELRTSFLSGIEHAVRKEPF